MTTNVVLYESKNNIAVITLNRPEKLNVMNDDMWGALEATWRRFNNSEDKVAIITAAGDKAFCVGADLSSPSLDVWRAIPGHIVDVEKPIVAAVFGHCLGGGLGLVQFADICVAAEGARFAQIVSEMSERLTKLGPSPLRPDAETAEQNVQAMAREAEKAVAADACGCSEKNDVNEQRALANK